MQSVYTPDTAAVSLTSKVMDVEDRNVERTLATADTGEAAVHRDETTNA